MKEIIFVETNPGFIEAALISKKMGYSPQLLTKIHYIDPSYYNEAELKIFDRIIEIDTQNVEKMYSAINKNNVAGVLACEDDDLLPAAKLAEKLSLPHPSIEGLENARCKDIVRFLLKESNFVQPKFYVVNNIAALEKVAIAYPLIFKPVHESGSEGAFFCQSFKECQQALEQSKQINQTSGGYKLEKRWLLEEYIEGKLYSAQLLWVNDQWKFLGVAEELICPKKSLVIYGFAFPVYFDEILYHRIETEVIAWVNCIKLKGGAIGVEFKLMQDNPILIEINARLDAGFVSKLLHLSLGKSILEYLVKVSCGRVVSFESVFPRENKVFVEMHLIPPKDGLIGSISELKSALSQPYVEYFRVATMPKTIKLKQNSDDIIGYLIVSGANLEQALQRGNDVLSNLIINYLAPNETKKFK